MKRMNSFDKGRLHSVSWALIILTASMILSPLRARAQGFAISGHVGTTGVGGGIVLGLAPKLNVRALYGFVPTKPEITIEDIDFAVDIPSFTVVVFDLYPTGPLHLSAGALIASDGGALEVEGTFTSVQFGGTDYMSSGGDTVTGTFTLKRIQPYLGIGFGNPIGSMLSLNLDVGVGFGKTPTVELTATGPLAEDPLIGPTFLADLEQEEADIQDSIPDYLRLYPVLSLSVSVGF